MRQAIINENNIVTNVIAGSLPYGLNLNEGEFCEIGATYVPNGNPRFLRAPRVYTWTSYEFLNRFTPQERRVIWNRAKSNDDIADFLMLAQAANEVISDDPNTIAGLNMLVSLNIISNQRKNDILNGDL